MKIILKDDGWFMKYIARYIPGLAWGQVDLWWQKSKYSTPIWMGVRAWFRCKDRDCIDLQGEDEMLEEAAAAAELLYAQEDYPGMTYWDWEDRESERPMPMFDN